jgi:tRNA threonylcarbamoyladenosine biosynthesis protein TsaB
VTCGQGAAVGLSLGEAVVGVRELGSRSASAEIVSAVRSLLTQAGWSMAELSAVGVVNGPGSFTGMRTGLSAAKGFCEAAGLRLAAVSRLEVLAGAEQEALAVLDAGREQFYVRDQRSGREWLSGLDDLRAQAVGRVIVVAEERVQAALHGSPVTLRQLWLKDALPIMLQRVREERDIYPRATP